MYRLTTALLLLVISTFGASAQNISAPSYWKNKQGSELVITSIDAKGNMTGSFISQQEGFACRGMFYDGHGRVFRRLVKFTVVWKNATSDCKAETEWYGRLTGKTLPMFRVFKSADAKGVTRKHRSIDTFEQQP